MSPFAIAILCAVAVSIGYLAWRATIVFEIVVQSGSVTSARGRMPPEMLRDLVDVLRRARATGRVRGRLRSGAIGIEVTGDLSEEVAQRLRNVTGRFPAARIKTGLQDKLYMGNIDAKRDWGFAGDYVEAMYLMMQQEKPDDYVVATGTKKSVRDFVNKAAPLAGFNLEWSGKGIDEIAKDTKTGKVIVKINKDFYRPAEVDVLLGRATKAKEKLGWSPKTGFDQLVTMMMDSDMKKAHDRA